MGGDDLVSVGRSLGLFVSACLSFASVCPAVCVCEVIHHRQAPLVSASSAAVGSDKARTNHFVSLH